MNKALVIGAGLGGIATALRLKSQGYQVELIDQLDQLGGRARSFCHEGFKHDAGPTVITAPFLFDELFQLFNKKRSDYAEFVALDTWYDFYFAKNRQQFRYQQDLEKMSAEIAKFNPDDVDGYQRLLKASEQIFHIGFTKLGDQPFTKFTTMLKQIPHLLRLGSFKTLSQFVNKYIKHPELRQAFSIHSLLVGGNPFDTTSIYALIHFLERKWGIHFCMGGTGALVNALGQLMREEGITIHLNTPIKSILVAGNKVTGCLDQQGQKHFADLIVFNGDPSYAYQSLLPTNLKRQFFRRPDYHLHHSMGLFVLFFGAKQTWPNVSHHTIWMAPRFKSLLNDIFNRKILADDFSLYLHRPTATDSSFAPAGCDSFYVLCPVPNLLGAINWSQSAQKLRDRIVEALDQSILPGLSQSITAEFWMTPEDFKKDYSSVHGAGFSIAPVLTQSAYFRYHNQDPTLRNLFFAGAGTHPGAGIPGVLTSAKVVEKCVQKWQTEELANA